MQKELEKIIKDLKQCNCGKIKVSNPTPDGDEICPDCGQSDMGDFEPDEVDKWLISYTYNKAVSGKITENTSDGYHTFKELYEFRKIYNAVLFNEWYSRGLYDVHKSKRHSDGEECFGGGWFIVIAQLPDGQISNHYELEDWDLFKCVEREKGNEFDGHTPKDVVERLKNLLT